MTNETQALIWNDILAERRRQDEKHGGEEHTPLEWLGLLAEEFGELAIYVNWDRYEGEGYRLRMRREAIHLAAVAVACLEQLDRIELERHRMAAEEKGR